MFEYDGVRAIRGFVEPISGEFMKYIFQSGFFGRRTLLFRPFAITTNAHVKDFLLIVDFDLLREQLGKILPNDPQCLGEVASRVVGFQFKKIVSHLMRLLNSPDSTLLRRAA